MAGKRKPAKKPTRKPAKAKRSTASTKKQARPAPKKAAGGKGASGSVGGVHTLHEDNPWTIDYAGHDPRKDSPLYTRSRKLLVEITKSTTPKDDGVGWYFGDFPWEDHHGGGLWAYGSKGWFYVRNFAGMEWASQFCADPAKVEALRQNAVRFYEGFPNTEAEILKLDSGYPFKAILTTPITATAGVDQWTDSIFNASVPLPKLRHTGLAPKGHGVHHYPTPIWDIELFKRDDFTLWVTDDQGQPAAVVPVHPRGVSKSDPAYAKNYGKVAVAYATPGTPLADRLNKVQSRGNALIADADHPFAKKAFAKQT